MITEKIIAKYPLADLSTYKIGGPAEYFIEAKSKDELCEAVEWAKANNHSITVLGGGSNILVNDAGVKGLVLRIGNERLDVDGTTITVGAGRTVRETAETALAKGLTGIEWSIGIPGDIGGAIRGNAGAHGGSFDQAVTTVVMFNTETLEFSLFSKEDCKFQYRHSIVKDDPRWIVWEVALQLGVGDPEKMSADIAEYKNYRVTSQPKEPSAGCVFKNFFAADIEQANPELAALATSEGKVRGGKIGAGYLVQKLGMMGYSVGGAQISDKHANFVLNMHQAKAADVVAIIHEVKKRVKEEFGVEMEEEVQYLGF